MCEQYKLSLPLCPSWILDWLSQYPPSSPHLLPFKNEVRKTTETPWRGFRRVLLLCHIPLYGVPKFKERTGVIFTLSWVSRLFYFEMHCLTEKRWSSEHEGRTGRQNQVSVSLLPVTKPALLCMAVCVAGSPNTPAGCTTWILTPTASSLIISHSSSVQWRK